MDDRTPPCSCEREEAPGASPVDYERYGFGPDGGSIRPARSETLRLATLILPRGTRMEFWGNPAEGEVGVIERGGNPHAPHGRPTFGREPNLSMLEMYTRLAPKDAPVPELLLKLKDSAAQAALKKQFRFQELVEEPIAVSDDQFDLAITPVATASSDSGGGGWNCNLVAADFQDFACNGSYPSNAWLWCDAGKHYNFLDRWTGCSHKRKKSLGITAVCNTEIGYVRHYYQNCVSGNWHLSHDWSIPEGHWAWTKYTGTIKRARWVRHGVLATPAGAYFRAFTAIYN